MPIYDYVCSNCLTRTEFIHGIDAPQPRFCPSCGAEDTLRKAFVAPSVHFKGSGWAKKDRSTASRSKTKAGAAAGSGEGSGSSASDSASAGPSSEETASSGDAGSIGTADAGPSKRPSSPASSSASNEA